MNIDNDGWTTPQSVKLTVPSSQGIFSCNLKYFESGSTDERDSYKFSGPTCFFQREAGILCDLVI